MFIALVLMIAILLVFCMSFWCLIDLVMAVMPASFKWCLFGGLFALGTIAAMIALFKWWLFLGLIVLVIVVMPAFFKRCLFWGLIALVIAVMIALFRNWALIVLGIIATWWYFFDTD